MSASSGTREAPGRRIKWREFLGYGLVAGSIWLSWEIVKAPFLQRAPAALALRLAPGSPEVARRAAEEALIADNVEGAKKLADRSLLAAPFNARALRVRGLAEARAGHIDSADQMLTLAGNWSLRDDPAHAWLVEHRLRVGNYTSSFAHADTLARRRSDLHPQLFDLFTTAAIADPAALKALLGTLASDSPWRLPYIDYLNARTDADALTLALGTALNRSARPLTDYESGQIYRAWVAEGRFDAIRALAASRTGRPLPLIANGDFSEALTPETLPLGWNLRAGPGVMTQIVPGDEAGRQALMAHYSGYARASLAEQLLLLAPGRYRLFTDHLVDTAVEDTHLVWKLRCAATGKELVELPLPGGAADERSTARAAFVAPEGCNAQWLSLETTARDRRRATGVTIFRVSISREPS